jgi:hypothetical protein
MMSLSAEAGASRRSAIWIGSRLRAASPTLASAMPMCLSLIAAIIVSLMP